VEKRKQRRVRKRLTCELVVGCERHAALVRDLSPQGLFVQTRVRLLAPGTELAIVFPAYEGRAELRVQARVARQRQVPPRLQGSVPGGVGLTLIDPPAAYRDLLDGQSGPEPREPLTPPPAGAAGVRTFRVRVSPRDKPGSRVITVRSESLHGARARALARAGRGWKIADIQEI
jgi:hypothetical protein